MSQGEQKDSITDLRKWNLVAGGIDPKNDVIPASLGYGLENALEFAMTEIGRLEARIKGMEKAGDVLYDGWIGYGFTKDAHLAAWRKAKDSQ